MAELKIPVIATEGITPEQKATPEFQKAYTDMMRNLTAPGFLDALYAHEAAHLVYYEMMGHRSQVRLLPTVLRFSQEKQTYVGHYAAIQLAEEPMLQIGADVAMYISQMAYVKVAGGVVGRKLFPASTGGDEGDKENFKELCDGLARASNGLYSVDVEQTWSSARAEVERQLAEHPEIMDRIQKVAAEIRPLFLNQDAHAGS